MTKLSGRMHWLVAGLALLTIVEGTTNREAFGQAPLKPASAAKRKADVAPAYGAPSGVPGGVMQASGYFPDAPMSMVLEGPPPMDVVYAGAHGSCDASCDAMGGCSSCNGCNSCGGGACGGLGCGNMGILGGGKSRPGRGLLGRRGACGSCGGSGCGACGGRGGRGGGLLGGGGSGLGPYSEAGSNGQRWWDFYAGTIALARTSDVGGVSSTIQNLTTGEFESADVISTFGIAGTPALAVSDLDFDELRWGLELAAALQVGVGSSVEVRYFGLNNWSEEATASTVASGVPTLYSIFSDFGTDPLNGFDDTDRSFVHRISYNSEIHNGEVNYRRRWMSAFGVGQGSFLVGLRHFDLDERFGFNAVGATNNTFRFDELRFFEYSTETRNQLTGVQAGGDFWVGLLPGLMTGVEGKAGIFGNHAEVESEIIANSIPGAREHMQEGKTAYLLEASAQAVYRLNYSWSLRAAYNVLYVENVALAPENYNTRDMTNAFGSSNTFTLARFPFLNVDGDVLYQGFSVGTEWMW